MSFYISIHDESKSFRFGRRGVNGHVRRARRRHATIEVHRDSDGADVGIPDENVGHEKSLQAQRRTHSTETETHQVPWYFP